ncbi:unnamed protein product [Candida verbasci]|uniref:Proteasome assembly chaperone 1 n=1 Tax=Candida verbasci TaxID=1227364 RepID=A0A9W4TTF3_9ASCO|nr:unnamed protein product [Candida verbasci]
MLFKPTIDENKIPRHTLQDEMDNVKPNPIPKIEIDVELDNIKNILILPSTLQIMGDTMGKFEVGEIRVIYDNLKLGVDDEDGEYDEDEQLYKSLKNENFKNKYKDETIPIYNYKANLIIIISRFDNIITYNAIAKQLVSVLKKLIYNWFILAPCSLNNNQSINKLIINKEYVQTIEIPLLKPPHVVTGIGGALLSELSDNAQNLTITGLILNSEGKPGYEKIDTDSIMDSAKVLNDILKLSPSFQHDLSIKIRRFNTSAHGGGIYI